MSPATGNRPAVARLSARLRGLSLPMFLRRRPLRLALTVLLAVTLITALVKILTPDPSPTLAVPSVYRQTVIDASSTCTSLSAPLLAAQIDAESSWDPKADSGKAEGIAQFTPETWADWSGDYDGDGKTSIWDPVDAINSQAAYMCSLLRQTASVPGDAADNALAAYNAGPTTVLDANGIPDIAETEKYVTKIDALIPQYARTLPASAGGTSAS
ncbi:transglycosylase SLT domain-containing protein [Streptomyces fractus]|uniref:lytic transglycosylase domain-containing protein n=1 Tax=Streptomyces fractus TaxID=641806 RepID=UPI003CEAE4E6